MRIPSLSSLTVLLVDSLYRMTMLRGLLAALIPLMTSGGGCRLACVGIPSLEILTVLLTGGLMRLSKMACMGCTLVCTIKMLESRCLVVLV